MTSKNLNNKKMIAALSSDLCNAAPQRREEITQKYYHQNVIMHACHPFNVINGLTHVNELFYQPLFKAFPDLTKDNYILMAGQYKGNDWVSVTGHMVGTFKEDWLDIPANNSAVWIRFGEFYQITDNKIVETRIIIDLLDVMRQAGFRFIPALAPEIVVPGPSSYDGLLLFETNTDRSKKSLQLVEDMIYKGLRKAASGLEKQGLDSYWADDFMWYGPAGIGSTRGIQGFKDYHQAPFIKALPDRVGGHNHAARFADDYYICSTGWPSVEATHTGAGWLGIPAPHKKVTLRVMDWWRTNGDRLVENWVLIDIIEYLLQLDINIFDRLKRRQYLI